MILVIHSLPCNMPTMPDRKHADDVLDSSLKSGLLHELATMEQHPESVPINALVPIEGTPMGGSKEAQLPQLGQVNRDAMCCPFHLECPCFVNLLLKLLAAFPGPYNSTVLLLKGARYLPDGAYHRNSSYRDANLDGSTFCGADVFLAP